MAKVELRASDETAFGAWPRHGESPGPRRSSALPPGVPGAGSCRATRAGASRAASAWGGTAGPSNAPRRGRPASGGRPSATNVANGEWSDLSTATRKQRHARYRVVELVSGAEPVQSIGSASILASRDKWQNRTHAANNFVKAMRGLFGWAAAPVRRVVSVDPTVGVSPLSGRNDDAGFHAWTEAELARFEDRWAVSSRRRHQRLAFDVLLDTGLRRGEAVRLGRAHVRDAAFTIRTQKTGMAVIARNPRAARSIDRRLTGRGRNLYRDRAQQSSHAGIVRHVVRQGMPCRRVP